MSEFDRDLYLANINYLAKAKGIKIGDLEQNAHVSVGYLSRLRKEDNRAVPAIDVIASFADTLGVSVDTLINCHLTFATPTELYMLSFLNKLNHDTVTTEIYWDRQAKEILKNGLEVGPEDDAANPLFTVDTEYRDSGGDCPDAIICQTYNTCFHMGGLTIVVGDGYCTKLGENTSLYLMNTRTRRAPGEINDPGYEDVELYMIYQKEVQPLCNAISDDEQQTVFKDALQGLYKNAAENSKHIKVDKTIRNVIDAYMKGAPIDDKKIEISSDDLPF